LSNLMPDTVFLLTDTREDLVSDAVRDALALVRAGQSVVFLSRSVSAPEGLFREARMAGVCFIRYEKVTFVRDMLEAFDGDFTTRVKALNLVTPEAAAPAEEVSVKKRDAKVAVIDAAKCAFCYSCYRVCTHRALGPDGDAMKCYEDECHGCGNCAAICPGQAISTEIVPAKVYACENSAYWGIFDKSGVERIPCGGSVGREILAEARRRYARVVLAVCVDDACKHAVGGKRGCQQAERLGVEYVKASHVMENILREVLQR